MDIEILDFVLKPCRFRIAYFKVRYYQIMLKCDLVYFVRDRKVWVRMPEFWETPKIKNPCCWWPTRELSDQFQIAVLKLLYEQTKLTPAKIGQIHQDIVSRPAKNKIIVDIIEQTK